MIVTVEEAIALAPRLSLYSSEQQKGPATFFRVSSAALESQHRFEAENLSFS